MVLARSTWALFSFLALVGGCAAHQASLGDAPDDFGVLLMAHGGTPDWNAGVLAALAPLQETYKIEVAFGMADATTIQEAVRDLETRGARRIGVVRLFVSGESWYERTQQVLRLRPGEPEPMVASGHGSHPDPGNHPGHGGHPGGSGHHDPPAFFRIETEASFALSGQGLAEAVDMGPILADRAIALSREPGLEDVLILAHGPGDDGENERWLAFIDARSDSVRASLPFRRVQVETLREDWAEKRKEARARIRAFVTRATDEGGRAIVIPFRVQGFGPYGDVLEGLDYVSDGQGLIPHRNVTGWIEAQIRTLRAGPFESVID